MALFEKILDESVFTSDTIEKGKKTELTDQAITSDAINFGYLRTQEEIQPIADTIEKHPVKSMTEVVMPSDALQNGIKMELPEQITPIDTITKSKSQTLSESMLVSELFSPTGFKVISLFLNGIDRVELIEKGSLSWTRILTRHGATAEFTLLDRTQLFVPKNGMEVEIHISNIKKFGGILSVRELATTGKGVYRFPCDALDFTKLLDGKLVNRTFESAIPAGQMVKTIIAEFAAGSGIKIDKVQDGPTIDFASFRFNKVSDVIRAIASRAKFDWFVDQYRVINFRPINETYAPFAILDNEEGYRNLSIKENTAQVRNRIIVDGGIIISPSFTQTWRGNGNSREFSLAYKASDTPSVKLQGISKSVGIDNVDADTDFDFLFNSDEKLLKNGANTGTLTTEMTLQAIYTYEIPLVATVDDGASQSQLKSDEGSDGIYEAVISGEGLETVEAARDLGRAEAEKSAREVLSGSFETREAGFEPGQQLLIHLPSAGLENRLSTIRSVKAKSEGAGHIIYTVEFGARDEFEDFMADAFKRGKEAKFRRRGRKAEEGDEVKDQSVVSPEQINMLDFLSSTSETGEPSGYEGQPNFFPVQSMFEPWDPQSGGWTVVAGAGFVGVVGGEAVFGGGDIGTFDTTIQRDSFSTDTQGAKGIEISLKARLNANADPSASSIRIQYNMTGGGIEKFGAPHIGTTQKTFMIRHFSDGKVLRFVDGVEISRHDYGALPDTGAFRFRVTLSGPSFLTKAFIDDVKVQTF